MAELNYMGIPGNPEKPPQNDIKPPTQAPSKPNKRLSDCATARCGQ